MFGNEDPLPRSSKRASKRANEPQQVDGGHAPSPQPPPPPEFFSMPPKRTPVTSPEPQPGLPEDSVLHVAQIRDELLTSLAEPEDMRKMHMKKLLRRWHPDKNADADKVVATAVF